jgi:hypothetical protein
MIRLAKGQITYHPSCPTAPTDFPRVVCLVGSSRFKAKFHEVGAKLEKAGTLVLMMSFFQHADPVEVTPADREALRKVDRARIDLADEVWVIDGLVGRCWGCRNVLPSDSLPAATVNGVFASPCCGAEITYQNYVGADTKEEIAYAESVGTPVLYLSQMGQLAHTTS